jgi:hypothetical protein
MACAPSRLVKAPLWSTCLVLGCTTIAVPLAATEVPRPALSFKMLGGTTLEGQLLWPEFFGADGPAASRLNAWVASRWGAENGCIDKAPGTYSRELTVFRLTPLVAVFIDSEDASCPNALHPSTSREQLVVEVASGKTVNVWEALSTASRARLRAQVSELGLRTRAGDECAEEYQVDRLSEELVVVLKDKAIEVEPTFTYAVRACVEPLSMSIDAFRRHVETEGLVHQVLETW